MQPSVIFFFNWVRPFTFWKVKGVQGPNTCTIKTNGKNNSLINSYNLKNFRDQNIGSSESYIDCYCIVILKPFIFLFILACRIKCYAYPNNNNNNNNPSRNRKLLNILKTVETSTDIFLLLVSRFIIQYVGHDPREWSPPPKTGSTQISWKLLRSLLLNHVYSCSLCQGTYTGNCMCCKVMNPRQVLTPQNSRKCLNILKNIKVTNPEP